MGNDRDTESFRDQFLRAVENIGSLNVDPVALAARFGVTVGQVTEAIGQATRESAPRALPGDDIAPAVTEALRRWQDPAAMRADVAEIFEALGMPGP